VFLIVCSERGNGSEEMFVGIRRVGALLIFIRQLYGILMSLLFSVFLMSDMLRVVSVDILKYVFYFKRPFSPFKQINCTIFIYIKLGNNFIFVAQSQSVDMDVLTDDMTLFSLTTTLNFLFCVTFIIS
jgi:hypothetical protein